MYIAGLDYIQINTVYNTYLKIYPLSTFPENDKIIWFTKFHLLKKTNLFQNRSTIEKNIPLTHVSILKNDKPN